MWYLVIEVKGVPCVVADHRDRPREFPKFSKLNNFVNGRPHLQKFKKTVVEDISDIPGRHRVSP
jgi:hypothetical protein